MKPPQAKLAARGKSKHGVLLQLGGFRNWFIGRTVAASELGQDLTMHQSSAAPTKGSPNFARTLYSMGSRPGSATDTVD